jgi:ubiquinone/menaquinone biosynthesis C-methylase UbiE
MTNQIHYPLVQSDDEFDRLIEQNRFYGELTERVLLAAGIQQGMRLLDVGCGGGDVSFLLARLVGPQGAVVGVDRSPTAITQAEKRANSARLENVKFLLSELPEFSSAQHFDAAVDASS